MNSTDLSAFKGRMLSVAHILLVLAFLMWWGSGQMLRHNEGLLNYYASTQKTVDFEKSRVNQDPNTWDRLSAAVKEGENAFREVRSESYSSDLVVGLRYGGGLLGIVGAVLLAVGLCVPGHSTKQKEKRQKQERREQERQAQKQAEQEQRRQNAEKLFNLGTQSFFGMGTHEDKEAGIGWYRKAAEQGHAEAQFTLGMYYCYGHGVLEDNAEGLKWFYRAAGQGHAKAKEQVPKIERQERQRREIQAQKNREMFLKRLRIIKEKIIFSLWLLVLKPHIFAIGCLIAMVVVPIFGSLIIDTRYGDLIFYLFLVSAMLAILFLVIWLVRCINSNETK